MAEELQGLLDRIQQDGIDKAEAEASKRIEAAGQEAKRITDAARKEADTVVKQAEQEAAAFQAHGQKALEQAARDVVIAVGDRMSALLRELANRQVAQALTPDALADMLCSVVKAYAESGGTSGRLDVLLSPTQQEALRNHFMGALADSLSEGVEIKGDENIISGFKVSVLDEKVHHDFTGEAIADAICSLLRPHLAQIVRDTQK